MRTSPDLPRMSAVAVCLTCLMASCSRETALEHVVIERFVEGSFDQTAWRIDPRKLPEASYDFDEDGLAIHVPTEATGGAPAELKSLFKVGGNFEISLDYSIQSLPRPEQGSTNLEVSLYGSGGSAAFMRTERSDESGFAIWFQPSGDDADTFWRFQEIDGGEEGRSQLLVKRDGSEISFLARSSPDREFVEIGTLEYPTSIGSLQFRVIGKPVSQPVDVRFHEVRVAADNIWYGGSAPDDHALFGIPVRLLSTALAVLLTAAGLFLLYRYYSAT